jgi:serine/threonine-protein kinase
MVTRDGSIKVVDFGIAKALFDTADEQTRSRSIKGKLSYMAPEQLAGQLLSCAADVYSAGVVLHELLTGRRLFTVSSPLAMSMVHEARVPPPSSINPAVPPVLDAVCARALAFSPTERFTDGQEMYEALAPIATQLRFGRAELAAALAWAMPAAHEPTAGTATVADRAALLPTLREPRHLLRWTLALAALVAIGVGVGLGARKLTARSDRAAIAPARAPAPPTPNVATPPPPANVATAPSANAATPPPEPIPPAPTTRARPKAAHKKSHARPAPTRDGLPDGTLAPF